MEGGPPMFRQGFTCPALLKDLCKPYAYGAITHSGMPFQTFWLNFNETTGLLRFRSPLLAESQLMSFPPGTEMFQFPGFASPRLWIQPAISLRRGCPIRTSADQRSLASPRGFSQRATSFIASWRQGIHRTPLSHSPSRHQPPARRTKPRPAIPAFAQYQASRSSLTHAYQPIQLHLSKNTRRAARPLTGRQRQTAVLEARIALRPGQHPPRGRTARR